MAFSSPSLTLHLFGLVRPNTVTFLPAMEELAKDAICFGRNDELEELLDKGVDPNAKDESGTGYRRGWRSSRFSRESGLVLPFL